MYIMYHKRLGNIGYHFSFCQTLPIFLDHLVTAWGAILISVTLILLFGEVRYLSDSISVFLRKLIRDRWLMLVCLIWYVLLAHMDNFFLRWPFLGLTN